ncbi:hypothetical protein ACPXCG_21460 [Gordonia sp. DT218]|uniref:hypothetical protein n=1 Tax=Gordonia sp. DT218 TaxID=3416659 RepID=UPI003CF546AD
MYPDSPENRPAVDPHWTQPLPPAQPYYDPRSQPFPPQQPPAQYYPVAPIYQSPPVVVVGSTKSVGLAFLLAFLFGPLGMLYSTVAGALIMICVSILAFFVSIFTLGVPIFFVWVACIIWSCIAASNHNDTLRRHTTPYY